MVWLEYSGVGKSYYRSSMPLCKNKGNDLLKEKSERYSMTGGSKRTIVLETQRSASSEYANSYRYMTISYTLQ